MSRDELEPCPFCGGEAERIDFSAEDQGDPNAGGSCISCERCGASSPVHFDRKENLLSSWNQRAALTSPRPSGEMVEDFLAELDGWEGAYPLAMFPEPDLERAAEVLKAHGMTLDAISASNMRHVVQRIAPKAREVIAALSTASNSPSLGVETFNPETMSIVGCKCRWCWHWKMEDSRFWRPKDSALSGQSGEALGQHD